MKVYIEEAGCKRRQLDIRTIKKYLVSNGHSLVQTPEEADRIVVGTCAFKQKEEDDSVKRLRFFRKYGREILVFGCLPDIAQERFREFADFHSVAPKNIECIDKYFAHDTVEFSAVVNANTLASPRPNLARSLKRRIQSGDLLNGNLLAEMTESGIQRLKSLLSKPADSWFLFVCRGCRGNCSYCAIRRSVGPVKSKPSSVVVDEFHAGIRAGFRDFSILGDDPGCYGLDNRENLPQLLQALRLALATEELPVAQRDAVHFHIKEIHPKFMIEYADALVEQPLMRQVQSLLCPIQSGSDRVLDLMQREHTTEALRTLLLKTRREHPRITLETQIIVGFPTETEADFQATLAEVRAAEFNSVVVFPYHDKPGTPASTLPSKVPAGIIRSRMRSAFSTFRKQGIKAYYSCP